MCVCMGPLVFVLIIMATAAQRSVRIEALVMGRGRGRGPRPRGAAFVTGELYGSVTVATHCIQRGVWVCGCVSMPLHVSY